MHLGERAGKTEQVKEEQRYVDALYARLDADVSGALSTQAKVMAAPGNEGMAMLLEGARAFRLDRPQAKSSVASVAAVVSSWRDLMPADIGEAQRRDFQPVFDWLPALLKPD